MHFAARKNVLEYDDVMNLQRKAIYEERNAILDGKSMTERIPGIIRDAVDAIVGECCPGNSASDDWDVRAIDLWAANMTGCNDFSVAKVDHEDEAENVAEALNDFLTWIYEQKSEQLGHDLMENLSAQVMLRIIDTRWMAHLQEMDYLKTGIGLRAFGQRDPLVEYKNEAYNAFQNLTSSMYEDYLRTLLRLQVAVQQAPQLAEEKSPRRWRPPGPCGPGGAGGSAGPQDELLGAGTGSGGVEHPRSPRRRGPRRLRCSRRAPAPCRRQAPDLRQGQGRPLRQRGTQRPLPLRLRQEVQEVPRPEPLTASVRRELRGIPPVLKQH